MPIFDDDSRSNPTRVGGNEPKASDDLEVEVNLNDQRMINEFSNLNLRRMKVKRLLRSKSLELDDLVELENELMLSSLDQLDDGTSDTNPPDHLDLHPLQASNPGLPDDVILYKLDSSYVHIKRSTFQETRLNHDLESLKSTIGSLNSKLDDLDDQMKNLKKVLYSKFGNTINLESGEEDEEEDDEI